MSTSKTFRFVTGNESRVLLAKVAQFCDWAESEQGWYAILNKGESGHLGQMAESELSKLRHAFCQLFDGWPEGDFFVDLRHHRYPLDAYCEVADVVRQIEEERGLPKDTLWLRLHIVAGDGNSEEEMLALAAYEVEFEIPARIEALRKKAGEGMAYSPFVEMFAEMGL